MSTKVFFSGLYNTKLGLKSKGLGIKRISSKRYASKANNSTQTTTVNAAGYRRPLSYQEQVKRGVPFGKRKLGPSESQMALQAVVGFTLLTALVLSPFLGKKLAQDPPDWLPSWYDFRVPHEEGMTRKQLQDMFIEMQVELHDRARKGEFSDLEKIDWKSEGQDKPVTADEKIKRDLERKLAKMHGWDKIQPLDDEEEYELIEVEVDEQDTDFVDSTNLKIESADVQIPAVAVSAVSEHETNAETKINKLHK